MAVVVVSCPCDTERVTLQFGLQDTSGMNGAFLKGRHCNTVLFVKVTLNMSYLHLSTDDKFSLQNVGTQACMGALGKRCVDLRWASNGRILLLSSNKCLGAQGKTEGSALGWYDCDETSELQQWECNNTLVALKGQKLFIRSSSNSNLVLSKDMGSQSQFVITGTSDGPCSRTHRGMEYL